MARSRLSSVDKKLAEASRAAHKDNSRATRETIESIAVAIILAFLFRAFVAEAFVIPTGSMAPTLQGRHMDVECQMCDYRYRTGASCENEDTGGQIVATTCPICRYTMQLDKDAEPNQRSFNGDRILVSKFAYEFGEPHRWDVIVFKYPGNAKQNYIKRLVGLPNETLWILHGDVYHRLQDQAEAGDEGFEILRKPPYKLRSMLQLVDDTDYRARQLTAVGWPERWQDWSAPESPSWKPLGPGEGFETAGDGDGVSWLRYRHIVPAEQDWWDLADGRTPQRLKQGELTGQLVTDFYEYNDGTKWTRLPDEWPARERERMARLKALGLHWVGDLAIEGEVEIEAGQGHLVLDLVEGGAHFTCRIDVSTGQATLAIDGDPGVFQAEDGSQTPSPEAETPVRAGGSYQVRFSNCDDQLLLWIDDQVIEFDGPTTYRPKKNLRPVWNEQDPGDLEPAGIGAEGVGLRVKRLRLLRDVYYLASTYKQPYSQNDYDLISEADILIDLGNPRCWATTDVFDRRRKDVQFEMGADEFFPMGDNSPESRDARVWSDFDRNGDPDPPPYVKRDLLIGKALLIYWPHAWRRPIPFWPNFGRMGLIR